MKMRPTIGAVSYLNTKPLVEGLGELANGFDLAFDLPSRLADHLSTGRYQVALIPSIEVAHQVGSGVDYAIVSDACIGCRGPVWSVKLMSRLPWPEIRTLSLDEGSRTSCALAKIILKNNYQVEPECRGLRIDEDWAAVDSDAVLIIGDRAMKAQDERFPFEMDLGQAWFDWTGLPFVFAVWTAHNSERFPLDLEAMSRVFSTARDMGVARIDSIAVESSPEYDLSERECLHYLRDNLHFRLGDQEKAGMQLFFDHAAAMNLIPQPSNIQFHEATV